jgi:hypothetical protein
LQRPGRFVITSGDLETVPDQSIFSRKFLNSLKYLESGVAAAEEIGLKLKKDISELSRQTVLSGRLKNDPNDEGGQFVFVRQRFAFPKPSVAANTKQLLGGSGTIQGERVIEVSKQHFSVVYPAMWFSPSTGEVEPLADLSDKPPQPKFECFVEPRDPEFRFHRDPTGTGFAIVGYGDEARRALLNPGQVELNPRLDRLLKQSSKELPLCYVRGKYGDCLIQILQFDPAAELIKFKWWPFDKDAYVGTAGVKITPTVGELQSAARQVLNNARHLDACIDQWALEKGKKDGDQVNLREVAAYLLKGDLRNSLEQGRVPVDLLGNNYIITVVGTNQVQISLSTKKALESARIDWGNF